MDALMNVSTTHELKKKKKSGIAYFPHMILSGFAASENDD